MELFESLWYEHLIFCGYRARDTYYVETHIIVDCTESAPCVEETPCAETIPLSPEKGGYISKAYGYAKMTLGYGENYSVYPFIAMYIGGDILIKDEPLIEISSALIDRICHKNSRAKDILTLYTGKNGLYANQEQTEADVDKIQESPMQLLDKARNLSTRRTL